MNYYNTEEGSKKLILFRSEMPTNLTELSMLRVVLDKFSIDGKSENTERYQSWEFDKDIPEQVIKNALHRCGCIIIDDY